MGSEKKSEKTFWFDLIRVELDAMSEDKLIEPQTEVAEGEKVVGTLLPDLRKLYTCSEHAGAEMLRFVADFRSARTEKDRDQAGVKASEMEAKAKLYMEVLWICVRDEFHLWHGGTIGIRKGWKVVKNVRQTPPSPLDIIRGMLDQ